MNTNTLRRSAAIILALLAVAAGGYYFGAHRGQPALEGQAARKILYYRNPMGGTDTSPVPKKDSMGMDYLPVYEGETMVNGRLLLYYRNPMNPADTSATPKKDSMGMDYVAVYEGEDATSSGPSSFDTSGGSGQAAAGQVTISAEKVLKLGVKSEAASLRNLGKTVRAAGRVEANERRLYSIAPKFEGWIDKLYVNTTGEPVKKGQALFDAYSPDLVAAQREYAAAVQGVASLQDAEDANKRSMQQLAAASLQRLKNWDISAEQLQALAKSGEAKRALTFNSPANGIVLEKKATQGMRFMPGETLYQIADLSSVWVVADVFEQDIALIKTGSKARVKLGAYPDKQFDAAVTYVYPTLNAATRTVSVRLEMANPQGLLKPAMFAQVELQAGDKGRVLAVPTSSVIDSGTRQVVLVQLEQGRYQPREVKLGRRSDDYVEVLSGIAQGERVVVAANFLIDAESNLKAALGGFTHNETGAAVGHQATGKLDAIHADGSVTVTHDPIASLGWPVMTMDFALANSSLAQGLQPGSAISFEIVERKPGEWVITNLKATHEGH